MRFVVRVELTRRSPPELLEFLRQLTGNAKLPVGHELRARAQRLQNAIRRLEKHGGFLTFGGRPQFAFALTAFHWQKPAKAKLLQRETGTDQSGQNRRRPGENGERKILLD